jgi:hypothetical protein
LPSVNVIKVLLSPRVEPIKDQAYGGIREPKVAKIATKVWFESAKQIALINKGLH